MTVKQLRQEAKARGIAGYSKMLKADLEKALAGIKQGYKAMFKPEPTNHRINIVAAGLLMANAAHRTVYEMGVYFGTLHKSDGRQVRKALRAAGHIKLAGARRIAA